MKVKRILQLELGEAPDLKEEKTNKIWTNPFF